MAHSRSMFFRDATNSENETQMEVFGTCDGIMVRMGQFTGTENYIVLDNEDVEVLIAELQSLLPEAEEQ